MTAYWLRCYPCGYAIGGAAAGATGICPICKGPFRLWPQEEEKPEQRVEQGVFAFSED